MLKRFRRIKSEFGTIPFVRVILLLVGSVGISIVGWVLYGSPWATVITIGGLLLGWALREVIVEHVERLAWIVRGTLLVSGILFFVGEKFLHLGREAQWLMLAGTLVFAFSTEFWARSDPRVVKSDD